MLVLGWFAGDSAPRAVFLALSSGPWFATSWPAWTRGTVCRCLDGLLVNLHLALCFFLSSGPRCAASWPVWTSTVVSVLGCFLVLGQGRRSHARCVQRHMPMVQTAENCAGSAVAVRLNVVVDISCRGAVADSHGPFPQILFSYSTLTR